MSMICTPSLFRCDRSRSAGSAFRPGDADANQVQAPRWCCGAGSAARPRQALSTVRERLPMAGTFRRCSWTGRCSIGGEGRFGLQVMKGVTASARLSRARRACARKFGMAAAEFESSRNRACEQQPSSAVGPACRLRRTFASSAHG